MKIKISENIRSLRKAHSLTQEQLAEALGVTVGAVYKWESGLSTPEIKLIMELADLFEVSVDMLLGYEQQNGNIENRIQRIKQCIMERDFEEAVLESEKALKKYPNNFDVVYASAMMYMFRFFWDKEESTMNKSNQLFRSAISLLYQKKDKRINEATILNYIANNYLSAGMTEQGLEILKQNNICNINSSLIGYTYAIDLNKPEEAREYLFSSFADIINHTIRTMAGLAFMYAEMNDGMKHGTNHEMKLGMKHEKNVEMSVSAALWLSDFFDSLKEECSHITFLDKFKAILMAQCAVWKASGSCLEEAKEYVTKAYTVAKQFDASPVYNMQGIKFYKGMEDEGFSFDFVGNTAIEAVENFVFGKASSDAHKWVKDVWEELKNG